MIYDLVAVQMIASLGAAVKPLVLSPSSFLINWKETKKNPYWCSKRVGNVYPSGIRLLWARSNWLHAVAVILPRIGESKIKNNGQWTVLFWVHGVRPHVLFSLFKKKRWNKNELTKGAIPSVWNSLSEWPALPYNSPPRYCSTFNSVLDGVETCLS